MEEEFMKIALSMAERSFKKGEVPIGAVIVKDGKVVAKGFNQRERKQNAILHAEMVAINRACKKLKSWRLVGCEMYVTCEPCPMCAGAILNSRIEKVYFGCRETKSGACGSKFDILSQNALNHQCEVVGGMLEDEASSLLKDFFREKRQESRIDKKQNKK